MSESLYIFLKEFFPEECPPKSLIKYLLKKAIPYIEIPIPELLSCIFESMIEKNFSIKDFLEKREDTQQTTEKTHSKARDKLFFKQLTKELIKFQKKRIKQQILLPENKNLFIKRSKLRIHQFIFFILGVVLPSIISTTIKKDNVIKGCKRILSHLKTLTPVKNPSQ